MIDIILYVCNSKNSLQVKLCLYCEGFFFIWRNSPQGARASSFTRLLDFTPRRTTVGRTLLDAWLARRRDLYLTTHNTHNRQTDRQTSMPPVGFEPTISAGERPQTYTLDRAATWTGTVKRLELFITSPVGFKVQILKPTTQTTPGINVREIWILKKSSNRSSGSSHLNFIVIRKIFLETKHTCRRKEVTSPLHAHRGRKTHNNQTKCMKDVY